MNTIITIICSSAFGAVISFLFAWITNRKSNSLNYITDERRKWRDKIREIIIGIENSKYKGKGNKNINKYLIQLEVNINPYGKYSRLDYIRDGHIWDKIKKTGQVKTEIEFENDKNVLLEYLELMLKKDWERSKNEVRGYSYSMACIGIGAFFAAFYWITYFYIFQLDAIPPVIIFITLNLSSLFFMKYFFVDELDVIEKNKKRMPIKLMIKKERKIKRITIQGASFMLFIILFNMYIGGYSVPRDIAQNMQYCKEGEQLYLYCNLDKNMMSNLEENMQSLITDEVVLVNSKFDLPIEPQRVTEKDTILVKAIERSISFWSLMIFELAISIPVIGMIFSFKLSEETRKYEREIDKIKSLERFKHGNIVEQLDNFMSRIDFANNNCKKTNPTYLGIVYSFLNDIKVNLNNEIIKNDMLYGTIEEYDDMIQKKENLEQIKVIMKQLKQINRTLSDKKKNEIYNHVKQSVAGLQLKNG